jgi:hypothetical protein
VGQYIYEILEVQQYIHNGRKKKKVKKRKRRVNGGLTEYTGSQVDDGSLQRESPRWSGVNSGLDAAAGNANTTPITA